MKSLASSLLTSFANSLQGRPARARSQRNWMCVESLEVRTMMSAAQPTLTTALNLGDPTIWLKDAPVGMGSSNANTNVYRIQIDQEQIIVSPTFSASVWEIRARGADGTVAQSHKAGATIQVIGQSVHDAGWDFMPNQPGVDLVESSLKTTGPELVLVKGESSKIAMVMVDGFDTRSGAILQVLIAQETNQLPSNLPNGINVFTGEGITSTVVSQEDPSNMLDTEHLPMHSVDLFFSALPTAPTGVTPIDVTVHQAGKQDIYLHLNLDVVAPPAASPQAPVLGGSATSPTVAQLNFTATAGATGYVVQRQVGGQWQSYPTTLASNSTGCNITSMTPGTSLDFRVGAITPQGTIFSNVFRITQPAQAVKAPLLSGTASSSTVAQLNFTPTAGTTGYAVLRWVNGQWQSIKFGNSTTLASNYTGCTINSLTPGSMNYFCVGAYTSQGWIYSNVVPVTQPR